MQELGDKQARKTQNKLIREMSLIFSTQWIREASRRRESKRERRGERLSLIRLVFRRLPYYLDACFDFKINWEERMTMKTPISIFVANTLNSNTTMTHQFEFNSNMKRWGEVIIVCVELFTYWKNRFRLSEFFSRWPLLFLCQRAHIHIYNSNKYFMNTKIETNILAFYLSI